VPLKWCSPTEEVSVPQNIDRLSPTYDIPPGEVAELYEGPVTVTIGAHEGTGAGRVWFDWERAVRVSASGDGQVALAMGDDEAHWSVSLPGRYEIAIEELDSRATMPAAAWQLDAIAVADAGNLDAELIRVDFQLANFTVFFDGGAEEATWRLLLDDGRWRVTIDQVEDASERLKALRCIGGGAVMHAGRLEHPNGSPFTWREATEILHGLQLLLAFAAGDRVPALLPVGYDGDGNAAVYGPRSPRRESYKGRFRWCGPLLVGALADVWPRFVDLWEHADTKRMWKLAGELYVEAQHGDNLETRIVDAQSLLEVLAWDRLVTVGGRAQTTSTATVPTGESGRCSTRLAHRTRCRKPCRKLVGSGREGTAPKSSPSCAIASSIQRTSRPSCSCRRRSSMTLCGSRCGTRTWRYSDCSITTATTTTAPKPCRSSKARASLSRGQRRDAGTHLGAAWARIAVELRSCAVQLVV
jgi:hypothetical protein